LEEENKKDILELQSQGAVPLAVTNTGELSFFNMMKANKIDWSGTFQNVGIARVREMLDTIKEYLNVLHTQQIVHNDVQQDNIMLGLDRNVRLVDFGQSQMDIDNLTPEQLERAKRADLNRVEEVFREITLNVKKPRKRRFSEGGGGGGGGDEEESSLLSRSLFPPILERSSLDFNNKE
jgi:serine/threonine protein kinase